MTEILSSGIGQAIRVRTGKKITNLSEVTLSGVGKVPRRSVGCRRCLPAVFHLSSPATTGRPPDGAPPDPASPADAPAPSAPAAHPAPAPTPAPRRQAPAQSAPPYSSLHCIIAASRRRVAGGGRWAVGGDDGGGGGGAVSTPGCRQLGEHLSANAPPTLSTHTQTDREMRHSWSSGQRQKRHGGGGGGTDCLRVSADGDQQAGV